MRFRELDLPGAFVIDLDRIADARGFFARSFCEREFGGRGLLTRFAQSSLSFNIRKGTVRGLHMQAAPHQETKVVRCIAGAVYDVIVDLRRDSPSYLRWTAIELNAENRSALYIPAGFAHGFQTLRDASELLYMIDPAYVAAASAGVRWNDPAIGVVWPEPIAVISPRDLAFPDWER